ncbi:glycerol-3-phosphate responsive antiterminator [Bacillus horti]|uniref:Glycerol uptake operon antiterminator regulatory protein n=1 Tax=Caldalkalibacillus horti TaxID=77523 RepID=A0ABT9VZI4_9BACI|nr:glycerol-3-phosphate responsive antiterminator [Bacillus horti]MDQ0166398.1 glycerol uptake operon antiterminator [Bacillus horti]
MKLPLVDMVQSQVIASIKDPKLIDEAVQSEPNIAFLLTGDLMTTKTNIQKLKQAGMHVFLHLDFIHGISNDKSAISFIAREWKPDGIITTKNHLIKVAKEEGLLTIQRIFLIDQSALEKGLEMVNSCRPDAVEVLPGILPKIIYEMTEKTDIPLIAGGLIREKEEVLDALKAGALAASGGSPALWNLGI